MRQWYAANADKVRGWVRRYREENPETLFEYEQERNATAARRNAARRLKRGKPQVARARWAINHPDEMRRAKAEWKRRNPEKVRAHALLAYYIRTGQIQREPCELCGSERSEGHHADYTKPRDVVWLCRKHHAEMHWLPDAKQEKVA